MSFLPPPPDPSRNLGFLIQLMNLQRGQQDQQRRLEDNEFNQLLELAGQGVPVKELGGIAPNVGPAKFRAAEAVGKIAQQRIKAQQQEREAQAQTARQRAFAEQAGRIAPALAQVGPGQEIPEGLQALAGQLQQQFPAIGPTGLQQLEAKERARLQEEALERRERRPFLERAIDEAEAAGGIEQLRETNPLRADFVELNLRKLDAEGTKDNLGDIFPAIKKDVDRYTSLTESVAGIRELQNIARFNPRAFGAVGRLSGIAAEAGRIISEVVDPETAATFNNYVQGQARDFLTNRDFEPDTEGLLADISAKEEVALSDFETMFAIQLAQEANPSGRISDRDVEIQRNRIRTRGFFRSVETAIAALDRFETRLDRKRKLTRRRAERLADAGGELARAFSEGFFQDADDLLGIFDPGGPITIEEATPDAPVVLDLTQ